MSLHGEPLFEGLNFKELFGKELIVDKVFWSYDGISLLCVCKDEDENCISVTAQKCEAKNAGSCIRRRSSKSNKSSAKARPRPKYSGIAV